MRKIKLWGLLVGIIEVDDNATDEEIWEEVEMFVAKHISCGWSEFDE